MITAYIISTDYMIVHMEVSKGAKIKFWVNKFWCIIKGPNWSNYTILSTNFIYVS